VTGGSAAHLRVDPIACDGRGLCAEGLPELITLDDWGFPIASGQPVPAWLLADARETVRACPKLALRLERLRLPQLAQHCWVGRRTDGLYRPMSLASASLSMTRFQLPPM
jgi:ferredoxin